MHITDPGGAVRVVRHVGLVRIEAESGASITGTITGFGLVGAPLGWSLGYTRQRWALLGTDCRVVWWPPSEQMNMEAAREMMKAGRACSLEAEPGGSSDPKEH